MGPFMTHDLSPLQLHILRELAQYEGEPTLPGLPDCSLLPFAAVERSLDLEGRRAAAVAASPPPSHPGHLPRPPRPLRRLPLPAPPPFFFLSRAPSPAIVLATAPRFIARPGSQ